MASAGEDWRSRVSSFAWGPVLLFAVLLLGSGVSAVVGQGDDWRWRAGQGLVLGVLALGIALDLRRRGRRPVGDVSRQP